MQIAVTGTTGRLGAALAARFAPDHEVIPLSRQLCDLADAASLAATLETLECDLFFNPAAVTSLEACEDDPTLAMRVNAEAPREISKWASRRGVKVIHFSTDYVFDGEEKTLRKESDPPRPLSAYGRSKLAGEEAVLEFPGNLVVRVSWIFGPERASFVDAVFDSALAGRPLAAIGDKLSLPALTTDLAGWMERIDPKTTGLLHACNSGEPVSWHGMACGVVEEMVACGALATAPDVRKQTLAEMTAFRAVRPRFTAMDTTRLTALLGHEPRPWRAALADYVRRRCSRL